MQFLISLGDLPFLIYPDQGIFDPLASRRRLVYTDIDRQSCLLGFMLETSYERTGLRRADQGDRFGGGGGDVVACFREKESLRRLRR